MTNKVPEAVLRILLVRHGETDWNKNRRFQGRTDTTLNEKGRAQAAALGRALKKEPIKAIYSSPITRAVETAAAINRYHEAPLEKRDGLMEMDLGDFEGILGSDFANDHPEFRKRWLKDPAVVRMPNGETLQEVQDRAWAVVKEIEATFHEGSVLLCAHNFAILMILCKSLGMDISRFRNLRLSLASISIIERSGGRQSVVCINDTCHLAGL